MSPADGALMFTNGGEGEETEIELAGKQVTGKLSTPSSPPEKPHDTHTWAKSVRKWLLFIWRFSPLLVSLSTSTAGWHCRDDEKLEDPRADA